MIIVTAGTETYGSVRKVGATPVVTRFMMLQFIPLVPLESFYLVRLGKDKIRGIPLVASYSSGSILGLQLARVDRLSVVMAYVRFVGALLLVLGFLGSMIALIAEPRMPNNGLGQSSLLVGSLATFGAGLFIGAPTYYWTYFLPEREKRIREICGAILGVAADPAEVEAETAKAIQEFSKQAMQQANITNPSKLLQTPDRATPEQAALLLLACRARIATGGDRDKLEQAVDALLRVL